MGCCCCGHPVHTSTCHCGCQQYELDTGDDKSPTTTGNCYHNTAFSYNGKYGGHYER
jgi:hypothetical protein